MRASSINTPAWEKPRWRMLQMWRHDTVSEFSFSVSQEMQTWYRDCNLYFGLMRIPWAKKGRKFKKQLSGQNRLETPDFTRASLCKLSKIHQVKPLADYCRWRITCIFHHLRNITNLATLAHSYLKLPPLHQVLKSPGGQFWESKIFLKIGMSPLYR